ncbi:MAG: TadE/TadG family type IV pilus assembly protein [Alphaproteobacteria bacterium]
MGRLLKRIRRHQGGAIVIEFAAALPVFVLLLMGGFEFARFAMANQKVARVGGLVNDYVAQATAMDTAQINDLFAAAQRIAAPFDLAAQGAVIVTTVEGTGSGPEVLWQQTGAGALVASSAIGAPGGVATLPVGLTVDDNESIVVTEVFFEYQPVFVGSVVPSSQLYYQSFNRPRSALILQFN